MTRLQYSFINLFLVLLSFANKLDAFHGPLLSPATNFPAKLSQYGLESKRMIFGRRGITLMAAGGGKKKRRRRKDTPARSDAPAPTPESPSQAPKEGASVGSLDDLRTGTTPDTYSLMDRPLLDAEMANFEGTEETTDVKEEDKKSKKYKFDLDVELPVESESIEKTGGKKKAEEKKEGIESDGFMTLPELKDYSATRDNRKKEEKKQTETQDVKFSRKDIDDFKKVLDMEPQLDSTRIESDEEVDLTALLLGVGVKPFFGIERAYLQAGHTVLFAIVLLCAFIDYPGLPLTELPLEIRDFLKMGLLVNYSINTVLAILSIFKSGELRQPTGFWFGKTLLLGGLAFQELNQIELDRKAKAKRKEKRNKRI
mmetsp:Transcript_14028/g.18329  ORF Transcript_14028/g.18329 Transcript_14028/m.18329 type:complete len:370 (+) Transcript_14028:95-1204(+)